MPNTDPNNLRLTTGRLFWLPTGDTGWIDLGNCTSHKQSPDVARVDHWKYSGGVKRVDHSLVTSLKNKRIFTLDEHFAATIELQSFGLQRAAITQSAATGLTYVFTVPASFNGQTFWLGRYNVTLVSSADAGVALVEGTHFLLNRATGIVTFLGVLPNTEVWTFTFNCAAITGSADLVQSSASGLTATVLSANLVLGRSYDLGRQALTSVTAVTAGATALVEDVDFKVDYASGLVTLLASTNFGSNWIFTLACAQTTSIDFTSFSKLLSTGTFKFVESDQFDAVPAGTDTLTGTVYVTGWGETGADKFQEFTIEVISLA